MAKEEKTYWVSAEAIKWKDAMMILRTDTYGKSVMGKTHNYRGKIIEVRLVPIKRKKKGAS